MGQGSSVLLVSRSIPRIGAGVKYPFKAEGSLKVFVYFQEADAPSLHRFLTEAGPLLPLREPHYPKGVSPVSSFRSAVSKPRNRASARSKACSYSSKTLSSRVSPWAVTQADFKSLA